MEFIELAKKRCSVRKYEEKAVEQEKLEKILEAGRIAPTAHNNQPQRIFVIQSKEGLEKLKKAGSVYDAPLAFVVCAEVSEAWNRSYDGMITTDIDTSIVTTYMMLQATDLDLATIWVCRFDPAVLKSEFSFPQGLEPINILGVGYPLGELKSKDRYTADRKPLEKIVFYENFN